MKVAFFLPYSYVWDFSLPSYIVGNELNSKIESVFINCSGMLSDFCAPQYYAGLSNESSDEKKKAVCKECKSKKEILNQCFGNKHVNLDEYLSKDSKEDIERWVNSLENNNLEQVTFKNIPVGKFCLIEIIIFLRKTTSRLNDYEFERFRTTVLSAAKTISAIECFINIYSPESFILYNGLYANERAVSAVAKKQNIKTYYMHGGPDWSRPLETMDLGVFDSYSHNENLKKYWDKNHENISIDNNSLKTVLNHYAAVIKNKNQFNLSLKKSKKIDIRKKLTIPKESKIILVALSSYDEYFGAIVSGAIIHEDAIFYNQAGWVSALKEFAKKNDDIFFVIRIHPREYQSDSLGRVSEHLKDIIESLSGAPGNVYLNTPADKLSLFDFIPEVNLVLVSWSTVAEDFAALGVTVLSYYEKSLMFPSDLINISRDSEYQYFEEIRRLLGCRWSLQRAYKMLVWRSFRLSQVVYDLNGKYMLLKKRSWILRASLRICKKFDQYFTEKLQARYAKYKLKKNELIYSMIKNDEDILNDFLIKNPSRGGLSQEKDNVLDKFLKTTYKDNLKLEWETIKLSKF